MISAPQETHTYGRSARDQIQRLAGRLHKPESLYQRPSVARGALIWIGKTDGSGITAKSTDTPGNGTVNLYTLDTAGDLAQHTDGSGAAVSITAYNLSETAVAANTFVKVCRDQLSGVDWVFWEDCT